ncbi:uncharacterized protein EI90DRAFT_3122889 [Cantharellus anzutake]|uniref:uncharacterized protein n=1 Tax=Cantharellus anzutake TaxID=1750568 RepID=UPI001902E41B|nr:uncharacterized protein EI90DRAFT_3122889 [Cantharellus anzutake]KAF8332404.1 hypothetical protein EI90DRAFT_3122889 [Cantharellus anzutake]
MGFVKTSPPPSSSRASLTSSLITRVVRSAPSRVYSSHRRRRNKSVSFLNVEASNGTPALRCNHWEETRYGGDAASDAGPVALNDRWLEPARFWDHHPQKRVRFSRSPVARASLNETPSISPSRSASPIVQGLKCSGDIASTTESSPHLPSSTRVQTSLLPSTSSVFFVRAPPAPPPSAHGSDVEDNDTQPATSRSSGIAGLPTSGVSPRDVGLPASTSAFSLGAMDEALSRLQDSDTGQSHEDGLHDSDGEGVWPGGYGTVSTLRSPPHIQDASYFMLKMQAWEERCGHISQFVRERTLDDQSRRASMISGSSTYLSGPGVRGRKRTFTEHQCDLDNEPDVADDSESDEHPYRDSWFCRESRTDIGVSALMDTDDELIHATHQNVEQFHHATPKAAAALLRTLPWPTSPSSTSSSLTESSVSTPHSALLSSQPLSDRSSIWLPSKEISCILQPTNVALTGSTFMPGGEQGDMDM